MQFSAKFVCVQMKLKNFCKYENWTLCKTFLTYHTSAFWRSQKTNRTFHRCQKDIFKIFRAVRQLWILEYWKYIWTLWVFLCSAPFWGKYLEYFHHWHHLKYIGKTNWGWLFYKFHSLLGRYSNWSFLKLHSVVCAYSKYVEYFNFEIFLSFLVWFMITNKIELAW